MYTAHMFSAMIYVRIALGRYSISKNKKTLKLCLLQNYVRGHQRFKLVLSILLFQVSALRLGSSFEEGYGSTQYFLTVFFQSSA